MQTKLPEARWRKIGERPHPLDDPDASLDEKCRIFVSLLLGGEVIGLRLGSATVRVGETTNRVLPCLADPEAIRNYITGHRVQMGMAELRRTAEFRWKNPHVGAIVRYCLQQKWESEDGLSFEWRNVPEVSHDEPDQG